jgi:hypothetical protein
MNGRIAVFSPNGATEGSQGWSEAEPLESVTSI